jgi:hypothetical protein
VDDLIENAHPAIDHRTVAEPLNDIGRHNHAPIRPGQKTSPPH